MNFRRSKALNSFFKDKATLSKKYKSIQKFLAQDFAHSQDDLKQFWVEHHADVYYIMQQKFSEFDEAARKGGKMSPSRDDVFTFMEGFKKLILALVDVGHITLKLDQTATILKRALHRSNTHRLRCIAFEVLLIVLIEFNAISQPSQPINSGKATVFGDAAQWAVRSSNMKRVTIGTAERAEIVLLTSFGYSIDLRPFTSVTMSWGKKETIDDEEGPALCVSHSPPSPDKSMELLEKLLEKMSMSEAAFQFWYTLFRDYYLSIFYSAAFPDSATMYSPSEAVGFLAGCPPMIQRAVIERCALWNDSSLMSSILWDNENAHLMMEIGRQSFVLPLSYYPKTIRKSLNLFRNTLMNVPKMKLFGNRLQSYWQAFLLALSQVFAATSIDDWDAYKIFCKEVIGIYSQFHSTLGDKLIPATWERLLDAMLSATVSIVETEGHDEALPELAMRRLMFFWVTSPVPGKDMWVRFGQKLSNLLHWRGTISHWKDRMIELTQMLLHHSEEKSEPFVKPLDSPTRNGEMYTDSLMPTWSFKDILDRWRILLNIFGNLTKLADPENQRIGMSCILEITNILVDNTNCNSIPSSNTTTGKNLPKSKNGPSQISPNATLNFNSSPTICLSRVSSSNLTHSRTNSGDSNETTTHDDSCTSDIPSKEKSLPTTPDIPTPISVSPSPSIFVDYASPRPAPLSPIPTKSPAFAPFLSPGTPAISIRNGTSPMPSLNPIDPVVIDLTTDPVVPAAVQPARAPSPVPSAFTATPSYIPVLETAVKPNDATKRDEIALSVLLAILPCIVEACCDETRFVSHLPGGLCAYQSLCKIMCAPNFSFELDINMRFCACLHVGFWASKEISAKIIVSSSKLFTLCRTGFTAIAPEFLKQIKTLFSEATSPLPAELEQSAVTIVNSLICYPSHFGDIGYARFELGQKVNRYSLDEIKTEISSSLMCILKRSSHVECKLSAICGSCVFMLEELFNDRPRKEIISAFCNQILTLCQYPNELIAQTSIDVLSTLSHSNLASVDKALILTIIICLCDSAASLMNSKNDFAGKENVILSHFWCLIEWIIPTAPTAINWLSVPTVLSKLLEVIELGYYGAKAQHPFDFEDSASAQKEGVWKRKKNDNSLTSTGELLGTNPKRISTSWKKKRRDSLFATSDEEANSANSKPKIGESPKLSSRKSEIASMIMNEVFRRGKDPNKNKDPPKTVQQTPSELLLDVKLEDDDEDSFERSDSSGKKLGKPPPTVLHSVKMKEAAETLLLSVLNHYQSFPLFIGSSMSEDDTVPALYFLHNNKAIWSFSDMKDDTNAPFARVIVRDCSGKYVWDFKSCPHREIPRPPPPPFLTPRRKLTAPLTPSSPTIPPHNHSSIASTFSNAPPATPANTPRDSSRPASPFSDNPFVPVESFQRKGELPKFSTEFSSTRVDLLHHFLEYLCNTYPEVLKPWLQLGQTPATQDSLSPSTSPTSPSPSASSSPSPSPSPSASSSSSPSPSSSPSLVHEATSAPQVRSYGINPLCYKSSLETKQVLQVQAATENQFYNSIYVPNYRLSPLPKPQPISRATYFEVTRQFLSNFGFLSAENRGSMVRLEESGKLRRNLDALDKINERENFKIGVVFVDKGQTNQKEILANSKGTQGYADFLQGLGWEVDLTSHRGFMGGLDSSNGLVTVYSASSTYEVAYHVSTLMPTIANDDKQLHKKRHIGNDSVHIVWSENAPDSYDPSTIPSQFNDAHIVIYPHSSGLCQVQICRKFKVHFFGPLVSGMLVSKKILPFLVRQTAINANKRVRERTAGYSKPFNIRQMRIQEIAGTCQKNSAKSFDEFFAALYKPLQQIDPTSSNTTATTTATVATAVPMRLSVNATANSSPLRSEASITSLDGEKTMSMDGVTTTSVTSLDGSDDDTSSIENSESDLSETSEDSARSRRFKIPKIQIPQSRTPQLSPTTPPGATTPHSPYAFPLISP